MDEKDKRELREIKHNNGQLKERFYLMEDTDGNYKKDGEYSSFYENGQKKIECTYKNGEIEGLYIEWYENGQKNEEYTNKDGKKIGLYTRWYKNGMKRSETTSFDGNGTTTDWHENGMKKYQCIMKNGDFISGKSWDENGILE